MAHFFGPDGKGLLDFNTFAVFLRGLQTEFLRIEFNCYDVDANGTISVQDFARSLISYASRPEAAPYHKRVGQLSKRGRISFDTFVAFNSILDRMDDIQYALTIYSEAGSARKQGGDFTPSDLKRAVRITTGVELDDLVLDTLFFVFDANGDGSLNAEEFFEVAGTRHSRGLDHARDIGFVRFMSRLLDCYYTAK